MNEWGLKSFHWAEQHGSPWTSGQWLSPPYAMCTYIGISDYVHCMQSVGVLGCLATELWGEGCVSLMQSSKLPSTWHVTLIPSKGRVVFFWGGGALLGLRCCSQAFSSCGKWGLLFVAVRGFLTGVVSRCGARALGLWALERRLSSCGTWVLLLHGMWDLPSPGLEPVSPALAGGFLTTAPPGKPHSSYFNRENSIQGFA